MIIMKEYIILFSKPPQIRHEKSQLVVFGLSVESPWDRLNFLSFVNKTSRQRPAVDCAEANIRAFSKFLKTTADLLLFFCFGFFNFMLTEHISWENYNFLFFVFSILFIVVFSSFPVIYLTFDSASTIFNYWVLDSVCCCSVLFIGSVHSACVDSFGHVSSILPQ